MCKVVKFQHTTTGYVFYQQSGEDGIAEPAISVQEYSDVVSLEGAEGSINLNYESIPDFIKLLKALKKNRYEKQASD